MRRFLMITLVVYVLVFAASFASTLYNDGDMLKALPAIAISEPWFMIFGSLAGDNMSYPEKINEAIDDDSFSRIGCLVLVVSGLMNASIIYGISRFFRKSN